MTSKRHTAAATTLVDRKTLKREATKMWNAAEGDNADRMIALAIALDELSRSGEKVLFATDGRGRALLELDGKISVFDWRNLTLDADHVPTGYVGEAS